MTQHGDAGTHGAGHYDSGNVGNISNRVFYYQEDNFPEDDQPYVLMEVLVRDQGQLEVLVNRPPSQALLEELRLTVAGKDFPLRNGRVHGSRITWRNTGLNWATGDRVSIMLTDHTVVGNLLQNNAGQVSTSSDSPALAQSFTTGNHPGGYALLGARLPVAADAGAVPTVSLYTDDSGAPGSALHQLSHPAWFWYRSHTPNDYTASDFTLEPDTSYWLVVQKLADKRDVTMLVTESAAEDTGAASGWSLGDVGQLRSSGAWSALTGTADTIQLTILAKKANRPATGAPTILGMPRVGESLRVDASGIADPDGLTGVSYSYQWLMEEAGGAAMVIPGATGPSYVPLSEDLGKRLRVRVSFNDDFENLEELTSPSSPLVGILVSNLGQPDTQLQRLDSIFSGSGIMQSQQFTTGSKASGYTLHSVLLSVRETVPTVHIYSDSGGVPGTSLHTLTGPEAIPNLEFRTERFTASDVTLAADTNYWVVIKNAGHKTYIGVTYVADEDEGGATGWSIGDARYQKSWIFPWIKARWYRGDVFPIIRIALLAK